MKAIVGSLFSGTMPGALLYQLISAKLLDGVWRPHTSREKRPMLYRNVIGIEAVFIVAVIYGVLRDVFINR